MSKFILVKVIDERSEALGILRGALHEAALTHNIKCQDFPVTETLPETSEVMEQIFRSAWSRSRVNAD